MCLRSCGSSETLKVKLKLEIVCAACFDIVRWYFFTYIHIDFKQADNNLRICIIYMYGHWYWAKIKYFNK
jgi:hypothetical protein